MIENFQLFLNVIIYFLNFSSIICMMFIITANFNFVYMFGDVLNNWSKGQIDKIHVVDKTSAENQNYCPEGFEYLFKFSWPGTKSGCNCKGITNIKNMADYEDNITIGSCSITQITQGCKMIPETPGKLIHSIYDKYYCIKRSKNFNYKMNYKDKIFENECPRAMKNCGIVDTLNNYLCVETEQQCPIELINIDRNIDKNDDSNKDISQVLIDLSRFFVDLKISQGPVCINNPEINMLTTNIYQLVNKYKKMKCPTKITVGRKESIHHDNRYYKLMNFPTNAIYYKEDFLMKNIQQLPEFPKEYFELPVTLYGRNYIGWKKKCESDLPKLYETYYFLSNLEIYSLIYLIASLIILIYCMILIMIMSELIHKKYLIKLVIIVIHLVIVFILFLFLLCDKFTLINLADFTLTIFKNSCSDHETNMLFLNLHMLILEIKRFFVLTIVFNLCILFLGLFKILLTIYKVYKIILLQRIIQGNVREFEMVLLI